MRTRILTLTALILALESSITAAQNHPLPANLKSASAALVVDRLLAGREARLHHDRGRPAITGLDRVPGKSVPVVERIKTTATDAYRQASAVLTPEQQARAAELLATPSR